MQSDRFQRHGRRLLLVDEFQATILFYGADIISHDQTGERLPGVSAPTVTVTESNTPCTEVNHT